MARPHEALMEACAAYASAVLPPTADYAATPIETGDDDGRLAERRKAQGARKGEPDGRLIWLGGYRGIEFKAEDRMRPEQVARHAEIRAAGGTVDVIHTVVEFDALFRRLGIPLRHTSLTPEHRDMMWRAKVARQRVRTKITKALTAAADAEGGLEPQGVRTKPRFKGRAKPSRKALAQGNAMSLAMVRGPG